MVSEEIRSYRLISQQLAKSKFSKPEEVVRWFGAMQAQDYPGGLWGIGMRVKGATRTDVEQAITDRKIVRTWPMRGTLHFVAAEDIRWMLKLMAERVIRRTEYYYKKVGLNEEIFKKSRRVFTKALKGGVQLTRPEIYETVLPQIGIRHGEQRGYHIIGQLAMEGTICFGPHRGKQPTFVLLDEWIPKSRDLGYEESLAEITKRYFTGHGPATIQDFVWWSGLRVSEVRQGIEMSGSAFVSQEIDGKTYYMAKKISGANVSSPAAHLLQPYDEYLIAFKDRSAAISTEYLKKVSISSNGFFYSVIILDGIVVGAWRKSTQKGKMKVQKKLFRKLSKKESEAVEEAINRYQSYQNS